MLLERIVADLGVEVEPFATCGVARGWRLRLPPHELVTLHFILQGEGTLGDGRGGLIPLPAHSLVVIPADLPHSLQVGTEPMAEGRTPAAAEEGGLTRLRAGPVEEEALLVACGHVRATWAGTINLFGDLDAPLVVSFADTPHMRAAFEALLTEQQAAAPGRLQMLSALMLQCLIGLFRRLCSEAECTLHWLAALEDPRLARAMRRVLDAPRDPHTIDSLAREAAMSRSAFAARFRAVVRKTPMDYVREVRLREAARLLRRGDLGIDAVAERAGFASRSHFSRAFRATFGQSPSAWRDAT